MTALRLLAPLLVALVSAAAAAEPSPIKPFEADYQVLRNGKELGTATLSLRELDDGTWEFSSRTHGTHGMAGTLGLDVDERSTFRWNHGLPEGVSYRYTQHAAFKSRERRVDFDWTGRQARSADGKRQWNAPLDGPAMDRSAVTVALMAALKARRTDLAFPVVDKDRVTEQRYRADGDEGLELPSGPVRAARIERVRADAGRTTTIWFAPHLEWLPVQIEQSDRDGTITMRFVHGR